MGTLHPNGVRRAALSDEVSTGELYRGLQEIKTAVGRLVSHDQFDESQRHVMHRLAEHDREIEAERHAREAAIDAEQKAREAAVEKIHTERAAARQANRAAFLACIGAIVAAIAVAAVLAWVSGKGGH
jgi:hypothetical protein